MSKFWNETENLFSSYMYSRSFILCLYSRGCNNKPEDTRDLFNTDKEEQTRHEVHLNKPVPLIWTSLSLSKFHFRLQKIFYFEIIYLPFLHLQPCSPLSLVLASLKTDVYSVLSKALVLHLLTPISPKPNSRHLSNLT